MRRIMGRITERSGALLAAALLMVGSASFACTGDCSGDGRVTVDELTKGVNIVLDRAPLSECAFFDRDLDNKLAVNELVRGVNALLKGCPTAVIETKVGSGLAGFNGDGQDLVDTALY